jgi:hypothetical protein
VSCGRDIYWTLLSIFLETFQPEVGTTGLIPPPPPSAPPISRKITLFTALKINKISMIPFGKP